MVRLLEPFEVTGPVFTIDAGWLIEEKDTAGSQCVADCRITSYNVCYTKLLRLNDSGIQGGEEEDLTIGLNWYATPTIRFMANYIKVMDLNNPTTTDTRNNFV